MNDRPPRLVELAQQIAKQTPDFQLVRGPGEDDHVTTAFMTALRDSARSAFGADHSERRLCGDTAFAPDFYCQEEGAIVEVAFGLPNSQSEFEKDILKVFIARETGHEVHRLVFISRAGAAKKCQQPGRAAFRAWAKSAHDLAIEVHEFPGEPRKRRRRTRSPKSRTVAWPNPG